MNLTTEELVMAREAANTVLEELGLDAYIFEVEPQNAHYELKVECACETDGGWASITLNVPKEKMLAGFDDLEIKRKLFEYWSKKRDAFIEWTCSSSTCSSNSIKDFRIYYVGVPKGNMVQFRYSFSNDNAETVMGKGYLNVDVQGKWEIQKSFYKAIMPIQEARSIRAKKLLE